MGVASMERFLCDSGHDDEAGDNSEAAGLRERLAEVPEKKALSPLEKLRREMEQAVNAEHHGREAGLPDQIKEMKASE